MSEELLAVWKAVRDNMAEIERILTPLKPDPDLFYKIRGARSEEPIRRAAEFIYLNKTCWNGLYRVNARGNFNVPYGRPRTDFIFDRDNMHACSKLLARPTISIVKNDFEKTVSRAKPGDFVYFDPPYVTKHNFNGFRDYNERLFSWADQERLSRVALRLKNKGVHVLISNAAHSDILDLYPEFNHRIFSRASTLSSSSAFRGRVDEVVFY